MASEDLKLLQWIHKNAEMGCMTIPQVIDKNCNQEFKQVLTRQLREYQSIAQESAKLVRKQGATPKNPEPLVVAMSDAMIQMRRRHRASESKLSEMMIKGSTNGTIQMIRRMNQCGQADESLQKLGKRLLETEERNIQELKQFL